MSADFESYSVDSVTGWKIVRIKRQCARCEVHFELGRDEQETRFWCSQCLEDYAVVVKLSPDFCPDFGYNQTVHKRAKQESSSYVRRVREFATKESYTDAEFKALCEEYDNVCVCCGEKRPLEKDHVIPLVKRGRNHITNIQPLCGSCHSIKGIKSTDYRKSYRKGVKTML